ncbi:MAG: methyl-accepting chemotaxis protein [Magnetococcales bacterium]|nr:methyl-accepting chemotaxis protein [Magnetococcales bacterium]
MWRFVGKSLLRQMLMMLFLGAFIPILLVSVVSSKYARDALEQEAFSKLTAVRAIKKQRIPEYLKKRFQELDFIASDRETREAIGMLNELLAKTPENTGNVINLANPNYKTLHETFDPFFRDFKANFHYPELYLLTLDNGTVAYSVGQGRELGTQLVAGPYKDSGLSLAWAGISRQGKKNFMTDISMNPDTGMPVAYISAPIPGPKGKSLGVVVLQINLAEIDYLMQERLGMGESGETYLVGQDLLMRSNSRFDTTPTIMKQKVDTAATRTGLIDKEGNVLVRDYRNIDVLSSYSHVGLNEQFGTSFEWAIMAEIDRSEAFQPVYDLVSRIAILGLIALAMAGGVGIYMARSLSRPLGHISSLFAQVTQGDLTLTCESNRQDEIGDLSRSMGQMIGMLREQTRRINEGTSSLASAISEITTTAAQLATSATESSTTIAEVGTTVEEVRHTAHLSNDKAQQLIEESNKLSHVAHSGRTASAHASEGIKKINEEMEYIAESIIKLSEQTQNIGEIIGSVNDLADQSNLLSVNASIEAAKAGEVGKGFGVVAQEVKSLAEQSREATRQIKTILNDIQKATSAAVLATERGSKAVESGVHLSDVAGQAIISFGESVELTGTAAEQIGASSRQQLAGMDQLVTAMENIKTATSQNVEGARQLESATKSLNDLGHNLKELISRLKV